MNTCSWKPNTVTLHDGRLVTSDSEEWRHECEARAIMRLPSLSARRICLYGELDERGNRSGGILQKRGQAAVTRLEKTIKALWNAR